MRPRDVGRSGSPTKIYMDPKWIRRHAQYMLEHWGYGSGNPGHCHVRSRLKKIWHTRLRRQGKEQSRDG